MEKRTTFLTLLLSPHKGRHFISGLAKCRRKLSLCQSVAKTSLCRLMPAKTGETDINWQKPKNHAYFLVLDYLKI